MNSLSGDSRNGAVEKRSAWPDMAEGATICTLFDAFDAISRQTVLWSTHVDARSQPACHPRCAARRRQRCARGPTVAAQPVGDEPGAGAVARDDRRSAAGQGRTRSRPHAPSASNCASGSASSCRTQRRSCAPPRSSTSNSWSERSRCGPATALWRTSDRTSLRASARKRPACGCASCRSRTRTARRFATAIVDLETGVVGKTTGPEVRVQALFRDRFVGVVRTGHPLSQGEITPARYAAGRHICVSRRGLDRGPIDEALKPLGLEREIVTIVGGFSTALALARASDLIASVPERHTGNLRAGMHSFPAPGRHAGDHGFIALASAAGRRSGASLAARLRSGCLRGAPLKTRICTGFSRGRLRRQWSYPMRSRTTGGPFVHEVFCGHARNAFAKLPNRARMRL